MTGCCLRVCVCCGSFARYGTSQSLYQLPFCGNSCFPSTSRPRYLSVYVGATPRQGRYQQPLCAESSDGWIHKQCRHFFSPENLSGFWLPQQAALALCRPRYCAVFSQRDFSVNWYFWAHRRLRRLSYMTLCDEQTTIANIFARAAILDLPLAQAMRFGTNRCVFALFTHSK